MQKLLFRDGEREVPDHLADLMESFETRAMTYDQAVERANWKMTNDYLNKAQSSIVQGHLTEHRGG